MIRLASVAGRVSTLGVVLLALLTAGPPARADSSRSSPATLDSILVALQAIITRLDTVEGRLTALASDLRPPSNGQTRLLFPIVSTAGSNLTHLILANTAQDPTATLGTSGECTISLFGLPANSTLLPNTVPLGRINIITLNDINAPADFQGYAVVTCDFPLAHGSYLVQLAGTPLYGQALVLAPTRSADAVEALAH